MREPAVAVYLVAQTFPLRTVTLPALTWTALAAQHELLAVHSLFEEQETGAATVELARHI